MSEGFARYLYVREDGNPLGPGMVEAIEDAMLADGLMAGGDGEMFEPAGALLEYAEQLGLFEASVTVQCFDNPEKFYDPELPKDCALSRCPSCGRLVPTDGFRQRNPFTGKEVVVAVKACTSCGRQFSPTAWPASESEVVFESRVVVTVQAEGYEEFLPSMRDACPQIHRTLERATGKRFEEVFIAW